MTAPVVPAPVVPAPVYRLCRHVFTWPCHPDHPVVVQFVLVGLN